MSGDRHLKNKIKSYNKITTTKFENVYRPMESYRPLKKGYKCMCGSLIVIDSAFKYVSRRMKMQNKSKGDKNINGRWSRKFFCLRLQEEKNVELSQMMFQFFSVIVKFCYFIK